MKCFYMFLSIPLGIVVSALAFHAGDPGSIPWLKAIHNNRLDNAQHEFIILEKKG